MPASCPSWGIGLFPSLRTRVKHQFLDIESLALPLNLYHGLSWLSGLQAQNSTIQRFPFISNLPTSCDLLTSVTMYGYYPPPSKIHVWARSLISAYLIFFSIYFNLCVCTHLCTCLWRPEEADRSTRIGVTAVRWLMWVLGVELRLWKSSKHF